MDQLLNEIVKVVENIYRDKQIRGENRYVLVNGKIIDVINEIEVIKKVVTEIADKYPDDTKYQDLLDKVNHLDDLLTQVETNTSNISNLDTRLTAEENRVVGIDYIARENNRKNTVRIQDLWLKFITNETMTRENFEDGFVDTFTDDASIDYENSIGIKHDTNTGSIKQDTSSSFSFDYANEITKGFTGVYSEYHKTNPGNRVDCYDEINKRLFFYFTNSDRTSSNFFIVEDFNVKKVSVTIPVIYSHTMCYIEKLNQILILGTDSNTSNRVSYIFDISSETFTEITIENHTEYIAYLSYNPDENIVIAMGYNNSLTIDCDNFTSEVIPLNIKVDGTNNLFNAAFCYDRNRKKYFMFGGYFNTPSFKTTNSTYQINTSDWTYEELALPTKPRERYQFAYVYDSTYGLVIASGMYSNNTSNKLYDLWSFDGEKWTEIKSSGMNYADGFLFFNSNPENNQILLLHTTFARTMLSNGTWSYHDGVTKVFEIPQPETATAFLTLLPERITSPSRLIMLLDWAGGIMAEISLDGGTTFQRLYSQEELIVDTGTATVDAIIRVELGTENTEIYGISLAWNTGGDTSA